MDVGIYKILYTGEDGIITTIDEVQLMENFSQDRINQLINLLYNRDLYISYQAMLILIAWGVEEGFIKAKEFIQNRFDLKEEFEPHRIYGEDNVYDMLAYGLYISTFNTNDENRIRPLLKEILSLYPFCFFESRLKQTLVELKITSLIIVDVEIAMLGAIDTQRYYQASQLLPVLHKISTDLTLKYVPVFEKLIEKDKRIKYNLEEIGLDNYTSVHLSN